MYAGTIVAEYSISCSVIQQDHNGETDRQGVYKLKSYALMLMYLYIYIKFYLECSLDHLAISMQSSTL